jgi:two-component system sensor histidine kinase KdpD
MRALSGSTAGSFVRLVGRYFGTVAFVGVVTVAGLPLRGRLSDPDLVMLYMLAIGASAVLFGRGPSIAGSALSVLAFDFFFTRPYHRFSVADQHYLLTFAMMFVVGLLTSGLTLRVRRGQLEATRSALLSSVSHDLRTPLAAITGAATTLRDEAAALDAGQRGELLDAICEEAERMERLVGNLLDMTRVQSGALQVKREWIPVEEVIGSALNRTEAKLEGRPVTTTLPPDLPLVAVDPVLLEQVLVNLLENAAKHTPAGTPVEVSARATAAEVTIDVADRGPGLPPGGEDGRLFEKFFRGPASVNVVAGAGLGLAICQGMMRALGGTIAAQNRAGGGALFRLRLPVPAGAPTLPAPGKVVGTSEGQAA